ncbi:MAG TPA: hypothetical protein VGN17_05165 [Bryobacteraceae bacterium]
MQTQTQAQLVLPASAVSADGSEPQVGDDVSVTVDGKVSQSQNGMVTITPSAVNGQPVDQAQQQSEPSLDDMRSQLISQFKGQNG